MALENNEMVMPVSPMGGNGGFGFGGDLGWLIIILLFCGGFGGFGGGFGNDIYPWMNQADITTNGFQNLTTQNQISAISSGIGDLQTQLCGGFAGVNAAIANGFAQAEIGENARQMNNMQTAFNIQSQLAQFSADNRLGIANLGSDIAREACATRTANASNTNAILEKLNQIEMDTLKSQLDAKNDKILELQNQLNIATFNASQVAQTAQIIAGITPVAK